MWGALIEVKPACYVTTCVGQMIDACSRALYVSLKCACVCVRMHARL
jgi:hypothetical protein